MICERCRKVLAINEGKFINIVVKGNTEKAYEKEVCVCQDCLEGIRKENIERFKEEAV